MEGRAIKEFTEFFDRGYWGMGTRKAEPSYDLFAAAMVMINMHYPARFAKNGSGYRQLTDCIMAKSGLVPYGNVLAKALKGEYSSARNMRTDMMAVLNAPARTESRQKRRSAKRHAPAPLPVHSRSTGKRQGKKSGSFFETSAIVLLTAILYAAYMYGYLL